MKNRKTIFLITGMHRSGTSLLGALIESMGINLPGELIKGDIYNKDGYYENTEIVNIQESLLIDIGRWWPTTYGCNPMPPGWENSSHIKDHRIKLKSLIENMVSKREGVSAIKDPRASLLIPLWRNICEELNIDLKIVASIRDPIEVVGSLMNRDRITTGMTEERASKLWYRHNYELIHEFNRNKSMLIDYSQWFNMEKCLKQMAALYQFCFDKEITKEIEQKAMSKIVYEYRRSDRNKDKLDKLVSSKAKIFHKKIIRSIDDGWGVKEKYKLDKWLIQMESKEKGKRIENIWFNRNYYRSQFNRYWYPISLQSHYKLIGWRRSLSPNILFNPNHYKHRAFLKGVKVKGCPISHFSKYGLTMNIEPNAMTNYKWIKQSIIRILMFKETNIEGLHPWGAAAVAVNNGSQLKGINTLEKWINWGLDNKDIKNIENSPNKYYSQKKLSGVDKEEELPNIFNVICENCGIYNWQLYPWIDLICQGKDYTVSEESENIVYLIIGPYENIEAELLIKLSISRWVYCTNNATWEFLHRLGVNARKIYQTNAKHKQHNNNWKTIATSFGLPEARNMKTLAQLIVFGKLENVLSEYGYICSMPNPSTINVTRTEEARAVSRWLIDCYLHGIQLAWVTDHKIDIKSKFWKAFQAIGSKYTKINTPELFTYPVSIEELIDEIEWRKQGAETKRDINPINYSINEEIIVESDFTSEVTVCISLYNYEEKIELTLNSVKAQTLTNIDLIIVNDCSTDQSLSRTINWVTNNSTRFNNVKVVSHTKNLGLSTARNTGFTLSVTEWIFVLDADNIILPLALESMIKLTTKISDKVGAVYSLIKPVNEGKIQPNRPHTLMNFTYWDNIEFSKKNVIDAMALIKKDTWEKVGGYDNIMGGWEDYDFWCKLIENGYCGIICPKILAEYYIHENSMITTTTFKSARHVNRQLQDKHQWLSLPMANEHKLMAEE